MDASSDIDDNCFSKIHWSDVSDTIVDYLIPGWVVIAPILISRSSPNNLKADAIWYPRTDDIPERCSLAFGAHNLLSRQVASTADCPDKDGPYC